MRPGSPFAAKVIRFDAPYGFSGSPAYGGPTVAGQRRTSTGLAHVRNVCCSRHPSREEETARSDSDSLVAEADLIGRRFF
jgi:hypothetical protein